MLMAVPAAAAAQVAAPASARPRAAAAAPPAEQDQIVEFSADQVTYDDNADVVTASGEVRMNRDGNYLAADKVVWERKTGQVYAQGQRRPADSAGRQAGRRHRPAHRHAARRRP